MLQSRGPTRTSRRRFIAGLAAFAAISPLSERGQVRADALWDVYAKTTWDESVDLRSEPDGGDAIATLEPGTTVLLLEGPDKDGWYRVDSADGTGWVFGDQLVFEQRARALEDQSLLDTPGDWTTEIGLLRHGFTVTLVGPVTGDWILVRSGERAGYVSIWSLEPTDGPETDRTAEYWVDVNRSTAEVRLYIGDSMVDLFDASLSGDQGDGFYATATGTYWIYQKIEGLTYTPYADAYFMYWAGFDPERFNGFHSWTMDGDGNVLNGGRGTTAGCVATAPDHAWAIYHFVDIGTRVEIHW